MSTALRARIKRFLRLLILVGAACVLGLTLLAYGADYIVFRYRVAANRQPFAQITVSSYEAVPQKNGKTEFIFNPSQAQTCVHALFPHSGYQPCWYLQRHREQRINI